jgi:hypothetical protein
VNHPRLVLAAVAALILFFAWGFLTEGWLIRKDFAVSAALYRSPELQMKYMPFGLASVLVALLVAVVIYARGAALHPALSVACSLAFLWECSSHASTQFPI